MTKELIRSDGLALLKRRSRVAHDYRSAKVRRKLDALLKKLSPKTVLIYLPLNFEANIKPCLKSWRANYKLYAPFIEGVNFKMVRYRLPLQRGKLKILSPNNSGQNIRKVDVMIVPAVAIDSSFRRIGFGKGMYDRFYSTLKNKPIVIFVQPLFVYTKRVVTNSLDIRADFVVTGDKVIKVTGKRHDRNSRNRSCHR